MVNRLIVALLMAALGAMFWSVLVSFVPDTTLNETASFYALNTARELGAANIVTAIVVTYRGLDTLGEVTVLFLASSIVGLVLAKGRDHAGAAQVRVPAGELLTTGSRFLVPLVMLLGVYVFANGHLTPGGGFQGGSVVASGTLLALLANPAKRFSHMVISVLESIAGVMYVVLGLLGMVLAGGFLDTRALPLGELGAMASAGAIPLIYVLIGLKVGAELSSMLADLSETEEL